MYGEGRGSVGDDQPFQPIPCAERDSEMHVISLRKAEKHEVRYYLEIPQDQLR
jgi:hypothetical protein